MSIATDRAEAVLARVAGLRVEPALRGRLERCLTESAAMTGEDLSGYVGRLDSDEAALQALVDRVTVQETWFFRDPAQFAALAQHALPNVEQRPLTVWSAACANGQEAYSLAMVLSEIAGADWRVVATDISRRALERTSAGRYSKRELRGLDEERRRRFLRRRGSEWEIAPALRDRVDVRHHNLVAKRPPDGVHGVAAVFCRNVLIYLRPQDVTAVGQRMAAVLEPGRRLFLGASETITGLDQEFELERLGETFAYRRRAPESRPGAATTVRASRHSGAPGSTRLTRSHVAATWSPPAAAALLASGDRALAADDQATAVRWFRQAAFVDPDDPATHASLGLALEAAGHSRAALRAFAAARAALLRTDTSVAGRTLDGFSASELAALLDSRLGDP